MLGLAGLLGVAACSSSELTADHALEQLKALDDLPARPDRITISGITAGDTERIVKADFAGQPFNIKFRRFDTGWVPEQLELPTGGWMDVKAGFAARAAMVLESEQAAAQKHLRALASAQAAYSAGCGDGFYAPNLAVLATPPPGELAFVIEDLKPPPGQTVAELDNYRFEVVAPASPRAPASCNGVAAGQSGETWSATATRLDGSRGHSYRINADAEISLVP
jgi:hypothetical protein